MMLNRIPIKQLVNYRLLKATRPVQLIQPKRFRFDDPHDELLYRGIGDFQTRFDWIASAFVVAFTVCCASINAYMNWDEFRLNEPQPENYSFDNSRFSDVELGIPTDDSLGYAPLKEEIIESGKILDKGDIIRGERRFLYHVMAVRKNLANPYDV